MIHVPLRTLGSLVDPVETWSPERDSPDDSFIYIDLSGVDQEAKAITGARELPCAEAPSRARQLVAAGDVLVSTVRPNLNAVAPVPSEFGGATASTGFCVLRPRPEALDGAYLLHWVRSPRFVSEMVRRATGASYPAVSDRIILHSSLPLPALAEQRRIAEVLDQADALRAKRRATLALLDTLTQSIFLDMFGDPVMNPNGWPIRRLGELLARPLRNGVSPSLVGKITAKVLTLSAVTGTAFDAAAWKSSTFHSSPSTEQSIDERDFLICRGNGSVRLVGMGYFPSSNLPDVTFPDTMIAARVSGEALEGQFLQHVWNSRAVRQQLESGARTTNGTFKVNQTLLEGIRFVLPPIALQREFSGLVAVIAKLRATHSSSLVGLDGLFAALQHRAFLGQLQG